MTHGWQIKGKSDTCNVGIIGHKGILTCKPLNPKWIRHCCHWIVQTDGFTVHEIRQNSHMDEYKWISVFQKFAILLIVVYMWSVRVRCGCYGYIQVNSWTIKLKCAFAIISTKLWTKFSKQSHIIICSLTDFVVVLDCLDCGSYISIQPCFWGIYI